MLVFSLSPARLLFEVAAPPWKVNQVRRIGTDIAVQTQFSQYVFSGRGAIASEGSLDPSAVKKVLDQGRVSDLFLVVEHYLSPERKAVNPPETKQLLLDILQEFTKAEITPDYKSWAERRLGEVALESGHDAEALVHFRAALSINPKIGVKRYLSRLEKKFKAVNPSDRQQS